MEPDRKKWPSLAKSWDDYGHQIAWENLSDMKARSDGRYVALAWTEDNGEVNYADLARAGQDAPWEMQNDSHDPVTKKEWRAMRTIPCCDWLTNAQGEML